MLLETLNIIYVVNNYFFYQIHGIEQALSQRSRYYNVYTRIFFSYDFFLDFDFFSIMTRGHYGVKANS